MTKFLLILAVLVAFAAVAAGHAVAASWVGPPVGESAPISVDGWSWGD